jgi:DNA repair protein SbcC/Rad50
MIVRRLRMENIRSYRSGEVEFPRGRTLFEGDIGAGKSTILMAIEFALFGLGSAKASSLLRIGEIRGSVELEFEVNGREYSVLRTLVKKGGSIQQVEGRLKGPEGEEDYPPSEMKEKILGILNFREPTDPKSKSLIFQYAIYTPQEEMKQVIALRPDLRLQILRRAFGVEEYKQAMENAKDLLGKFREKRGGFEVAARDIPSLKAETAELGKKSDGGEAELVNLELAERKEEKTLERLGAEREELHEVEVRLASAGPEHDNLQRQIAKDRGEHQDLSSEIEALEKGSSQLEARARKLGAPPTAKTQDELKATVKGLRDLLRKHEALVTTLETKIGQYRSVAANKRCPVCDQEADPDVFAEKIEGLSNEMDKDSKHVDDLEDRLKAAEEDLDRRRVYDASLERSKDDLDRVEEDRRMAKRKRVKLADLQASLGGGEKKLVELERRIAVLEKEAEGLEPLRQKIGASEKELEGLREKIATVRSDVRKWKEDVKRNQEAIARKERSASKATQLRDREIWLEEYFIPTLESIERHVMNSINREFGFSFQRWFSVLVDDGGKEAKVDEDFTPIVDQEGYEQDVEFLSGGERTSVALAYRLALSQLVQKVAEAGPSSLILDEPTDGFSKEQLGKVREILDEIANPQVIIVSHERELESFADQIYRVVKVQGESKITR